MQNPRHSPTENEQHINNEGLPDKQAFFIDMNALDTVESYIRGNSLIDAGQAVLAAVSGGADSMAMLFALHRLRDRIGFHLVCGHVNHLLRGAESDEDEAFVRSQAQQLGIVYLSQRHDVREYAGRQSLSIETAARDLRLASLEQMARQTDCRTIATAHHKDDQAETLVFRLLRGTAFAGLAGIRPAAQRSGLQFIRPMLCLSREQIEQVCRDNQIPWQEDSTNRQLDYTRNWIRYRLLPYLNRQSKTNLTEPLCRLGKSACQMQLRIDAAADIVWRQALVEQNEPHLAFSASVLSAVNPFIAGQLLRRVYEALSCGQRDLTVRHYDTFCGFLAGSGPNKIELPAGCRIQRKGAHILFSTKPQRQSDFPDTPIQIPRTGCVVFGKWRICCEVFPLQAGRLEAFIAQKDPNCQWFDAERVALPLTARTRKTGDRFVPYGMTTPKRAGKFLTESQIAPSARKQTFILSSPDGILWLAPLRRSTIAPITNQTKTILEVRLLPAHQHI